MTLSVLSANGVWSKQAHDDPIYSRLSRALQGSVPDLKTLFRGIDGMASQSADFVAQATTDGADTGQVIDLTDKGVDFLDGTWRRVKVRHIAQTDNDRYVQELEWLVLGGTTPVALGDGALSSGVQGKILKAYGINDGTVRAYGRAHYRGVLDAEATDGTNSQGMAMGAGSSGVYAMTWGIARAVRVNGVHVEQETPAAAEAGYGVVLDPTSGGGSLNVVQQDDGTVATNATAGTTFDVDLEIYPPFNCFMLVNSNNVELHVTGVGSETVLHTVEVFIGEEQYTPLFEGAED